MDIVRVIRKHGYTSKDVAGKLGIHPANFSAAINRNPTIGYLRRIADIIGADIIEFFADEARRDSSAAEGHTDAQLLCPHCNQPIHLSAH